MCRKFKSGAELLIGLFIFVLSIGALEIQKYTASQITLGVKREMPKTTGVSAHVPFAGVLRNLGSSL